MSKTFAFFMRNRCRIPSRPSVKSTFKKTLFFCPAFFALSAGVSASQNITVYTEEFFGADWGPGGAVKAKFEQSHPQCSLQYRVFDSRNTMLNRLRLEKQNTKADVVLGLDNFQFEAAEKTGLFTDMKVDLSRLQLPVTWQNRHFVPYEFGEFAFIYDKTRLTNPPKSLRELVNRRDLRVIYQDPRTSSMGRGFVVWMNTVYPPADIGQAWQELSRHTVTVGKGWTETYGAFLKGEADLVFSHSTSPIYHVLKEQKDQYAATQFAEGALYQYDTAARIKNKPNDCADSFIAYLFTPEAQRLITPQNVMLSPLKEAIEPHFDALKTELLKRNTSTAAGVTDADIKRWIADWQTALAK